MKIYGAILSRVSHFARLKRMARILRTLLSEISANPLFVGGAGIARANTFLPSIVKFMRHRRKTRAADRLGSATLNRSLVSFCVGFFSRFVCLCPSFCKQSGIDKKTVAQCNPQCAFFYFLSICSHNFIVYFNASAIFTIKMERDIHRSVDVAANDDCDNYDFDNDIVPTVYLDV